MTALTMDSLEVDVDGVEFACQVATSAFTPCGMTRGRAERPACPDAEPIVAPGEETDGRLVIDAWDDTRPTGITWALALAVESGARLDYRYIRRHSIDGAPAPDRDVQWAGTLSVDPWEWRFQSRQHARSSITLVLHTSKMSRPAGD